MLNRAKSGQQMQQMQRQTTDLAFVEQLDAGADPAIAVNRGRGHLILARTAATAFDGCRSMTASDACLHREGAPLGFSPK